MGFRMCFKILLASCFSIGFSSSMALSQSLERGIWAGDLGEKGYAIVALGERSGFFRFVDADRAVACVGILGRDESNGFRSMRVDSEGPRSLRRLKVSCPESFDFQLVGKTNNNQSAIAKVLFDGYASHMQLGLMTGQTGNISASSPPKGAGFLGVELGMSRELVRETLVSNGNFFEIDVESSQSQVFDHRIAVGFPEFTYADHADFVSFLASREMQRTTPKPLLEKLDFIEEEYRKGQSAPIEYALFAPTGFDAAKDSLEEFGGIFVFYFDNKAILISRTLHVNPTENERLYEALNEKYGSFDIDEFSNSEVFFNEVHTKYSQVPDAQLDAPLLFWGGAMFDRKGSKLKAEEVRDLTTSLVLPEKCDLSVHLGPFLIVGTFGNREGFRFSGNPACSSGTHFTIRENGRAKITAFQPAIFYRDRFESFLRMAEQVWSEYLPQEQTEGEVAPRPSIKKLPEL